MSENKQKKQRGRPFKHGAYSIIHRDGLLKKHKDIEKFLEDCRKGLIRDVAGSEEALSEGQKILIDRIISKLAILRLIEIYIERYGPFNRQKLKQKTLELEPVLGESFLAFSNSIRASLVVLGVDRRKFDEAIDITAYIKEKDAEKAAEAKKDEPGTKEPENA
jgi:hypothetical protein